MLTPPVSFCAERCAAAGGDRRSGRDATQHVHPDEGDAQPRQPHALSRVQGAAERRWWSMAGGCVVSSGGRRRGERGRETEGGSDSGREAPSVFCRDAKRSLLTHTTHTTHTHTSACVLKKDSGLPTLADKTTWADCSENQPLPPVLLSSSLFPHFPPARRCCWTNAHTHTYAHIHRIVGTRRPDLEKQRRPRERTRPSVDLTSASPLCRCSAKGHWTLALRHRRRRRLLRGELPSHPLALLPRPALSVAGLQPLTAPTPPWAFVPLE